MRIHPLAPIFITALTVAAASFPFHAGSQVTRQWPSTPTSLQQGSET